MITYQYKLLGVTSPNIEIYEEPNDVDKENFSLCSYIRGW